MAEDWWLTGRRKNPSVCVRACVASGLFDWLALTRHRRTHFSIALKERKTNGVQFEQVAAAVRRAREAAAEWRIASRSSCQSVPPGVCESAPDGSANDRRIATRSQPIARDVEAAAAFARRFFAAVFALPVARRRPTPTSFHCSGGR